MNQHNAQPADENNALESLQELTRILRVFAGDTDGHRESETDPIKEFKNVIKEWPKPLLDPMKNYWNSSNVRNHGATIGGLLPTLERLSDDSDALRTRVRSHLESLRAIDEATLKELTETVCCLVQGAVRAVLLVDAYNKSNTDDLAKLTKDCLDSYRTVWPIHGRLNENWSKALQDQGRSEDATASMVDDIARKTLQVQSNTDWLVLYRLISYLKNQEIKPSFTNRAKLLMVTSKIGLVLPTDFYRFDGYRNGLFIDPIESGMVGLNEDMKKSIRLAWRVGRSFEETGKSSSIGIAFREDRTLSILDGPSAGGLMAVAISQTLLREGLDEDATATFSIAPLEGVDFDDEADDPIPVEKIRIVTVDDSTVHMKFSAADRNEKLKRVYIHKDQKITCGAEDVSDDNLANRFSLNVFRIENFEAARSGLTGNAQIEHDLEAFCKSQREQWETFKTTNPDLLLDRFQASTFSRLTKPEEEIEADQKSSGNKVNQDPKKDSYESLCPSHYSMDEKYKKAFEECDRLLIHEDAGAGKSIFMRSAVAWLSTPETWNQLSFLNGKPPLAVTWERNAEGWPIQIQSQGTAWEAYRDRLVGSVQKALDENDSTTRAKRAVDYALENGRLVLLLDAYDQLSSDDEQKQKTAIKNLDSALKSEKRSVRIVVTSRPTEIYLERQPSGLFPIGTWKQLRLDGFSPWQQLSYLEDSIKKHGKLPIEELDEWRQHLELVKSQPESIEQKELDEWAIEILKREGVFGQTLYTDDQELFKAPIVLLFVQTLAKDQNKFPKFTNRADLYFQANDKFLDRNLEPKAKKIDVDSIRLKQWYRDILSTIAFVMMTQDTQDYFVGTEGQVTKVEQEVKKRIQDDSMKELWTTLWNSVDGIGGLTKSLILEDKSKRFLGWKHRGMMEFYCGLYLAKNKDANWISKPPSVQSSNESPIHWRYGEPGLHEYAADPAWAWAIRFAIELRYASNEEARDYCDPEAWAISISALFARNSKHTRPNRLAFDVWGHVLVAAIRLLKKNEAILEGNTQVPELDRGIYRPLHQVEHLIPMRESTARLQSWVRSAVDEFVEEKKSRGSWCSTKEDAKPSKLFAKSKTTKQTENKDHDRVINDFLIYLSDNLSCESTKPTSIEDQIHFATAMRYLSEHRFIFHGTQGTVKQQEMVQLEDGFKNIPNCSLVELQQDTKGNLLRTWMGDDSKLAWDDEPVHERKLDHPFQLHEFPMTNQTYSLFDSRHIDNYGDRREYSPEEKCPVILTSLSDTWMSSIWFGSVLPDEFQWEFACRGQVWESESKKPKRELFWFGLDKAEFEKLNEEEVDKFISKHAWWYKNSRHAQPVGHEDHYNRFGLCDMIGNVRERTMSPYNSAPQATYKGVAASFVVRGGSWNYDFHEFLRSSCRATLTAEDRNSYIGFRLCRVIVFSRQSS